MSNTYTKAAFSILVTTAEADLLRLAERAVDLLDTVGVDEDLALAYDALGTAFHAAFPPLGASRFENFLALFDDWHFPYLDATIDIAPDDDTGLMRATFSGDQFGVEQIANLIFTVCKSALPCGFTWSYDCDRLRVGEFGGGCVVITHDGPTFHRTGRILDRALARAAPGATDGQDGFVLAARDSDGDIAFWNSDTGFGALSTATVFTEEEAKAHDPVIAADEPEWLALPAPLHG